MNIVAYRFYFNSLCANVKNKFQYGALFLGFISFINYIITKNSGVLLLEKKFEKVQKVDFFDFFKKMSNRVADCNPGCGC